MFKKKAPEFFPERPDSWFKDQLYKLIDDGRLNPPKVGYGHGYTIFHGYDEVVNTAGYKEFQLQQQIERHTRILTDSAVKLQELKDKTNV